MRSLRRRCAKVSRLLLWPIFVTAFLFIVVSFSSFFGFTEKRLFRPFISSQYAKEMKQRDISQNELQAVPIEGDSPQLQKETLGINSNSLEPHGGKRMAADEGDAVEQHVEDKHGTAASSEKQAKAKSDPPAPKGKEDSVNSVAKGQAKQKEVPASTQSSALRPTNKSKIHVTPMMKKVAAPTTQFVTTQAPALTEKRRLKIADFKSEPQWDFEDRYVLDSSSPASISHPRGWYLKAIGELNSYTHSLWFVDQLLDGGGGRLIAPKLAVFLCGPSRCPDAVRAKAATSDWLRDRFLPNITLFIDRRHFSNSEWERLEHFKPPFGFMQLNYSLVREVITMLPPNPYQQVLLINSSRQMPSCISCAVVGNGGILNNSGMGQEIDSHDYVFRVSGAVIKGYEKDVGTRTSFYGFTAFSLVASIVTLGSKFSKIPMEKGIKYLHFLEGERDYEWLKALLQNKNVRKGFLDQYGSRPRDRFSKDFSLDNYLVVHPDFLRYMKNRFLRSKSLDMPYWALYRPTTGAFLLLTALHLCDQVSAYGFITDNYQKYSDHYYDQEWQRLVFYTNHDFDLERRVWKNLHDANVMKLYQRS